MTTPPEPPELPGILRALLAGAPDGILVTDERGQVIGCNEKFLEMWRLSRAAIEGERHVQLRAIFSDQVADAQAYLEQVGRIYTAWPEESRERIELRDGRLLERHSTIHRFEGRSLGRVWSFRDVTGRPVPAAPARPAPAERPPPARNPAGPSRPLRILLVEDHADTAAILGRLLRSAGHEVFSADTIASAHERVGQAMAGGGLDLVVSDLGLPDGSGLDLMRHLAERYQLRGIALSGFGMDSDLAQSQAAGFSRHLIKPVNIGHLRTAIAELAPAPGLRPS